MSQIININNIGKQRQNLIRSTVIALNELLNQSEVDAQIKGLASYIAIKLWEIHKTIDVSATSWEKRGYWVKADRFRLSWAWTGESAKLLVSAILKEDWSNVSIVSAKVVEKFSNNKIPSKTKTGTPWLNDDDKIEHIFQEIIS